MSEIAYTVTASFSDAALAENWLRWLREGHVAAVLAGGAARAEIVALDDPALCYEVRYHFPSREAYERYERDFAPRLRAEGLRLFPTGIRYSRSVGAVRCVFPAAPPPGPPV
jgi:hypothetical protein